MFKEQLIYMLPLAIAFTVIAAFQAYLFIKTTANYHIKFLTIPALLLIGFFSFKFLDHDLGYAYPTDLPKKFLFLGFNVIGDGDKITYIELWAQSENGRSRLYRIPFSEKMLKKLITAKEKKDENLVDMIGEFQKKREGEGDWTDNFVFYPFDVAKELPKGAAPPSTTRSN